MPNQRLLHDSFYEKVENTQNLIVIPRLINFERAEDNVTVQGRFGVEMHDFDGFVPLFEGKENLVLTRMRREKLQKSMQNSKDKIHVGVPSIACSYQMLIDLTENPDGL